MYLRLEDVRPLVTLAQQRPSLGRWRVIVIEDADRLNDTSGNLLLKAIEEPPPRTVWLLCAPSADDVLVTIRSRCRHVGPAGAAGADVAALLVRRHGVDPAVAAFAARAAEQPRRAGPAAGRRRGRPDPAPGGAQAAGAGGRGRCRGAGGRAAGRGGGGGGEGGHRRA